MQGSVRAKSYNVDTKRFKQLDHSFPYYKQEQQQATTNHHHYNHHQHYHHHYQQPATRRGSQCRPHSPGKCQEDVWLHWHGTRCYWMQINFTLR
ncbi:hypothetical protein E2C01_070879 [Portunus trituberculatus]|uniref:Uncharacterized protein n=1 Tax=Portunus trituberculatus TaxID=210409 RepID=A0A5B7I3D9_PORTR|nr:hypothetical protein [Portunus trituberculatus]